MCEKHVFFDSLYRKSPYRKPVEAFVRGDFDMVIDCEYILKFSREDSVLKREHKLTQMH